MLAKGANTARGGSRAMVETIAVTDGELTALSALSGQQLLAANFEDLAQSETPSIIEETVCVTVPGDESMEVEEDKLILPDDGMELVNVETSFTQANVEVPASRLAETVVVSANNFIRGTPVFLSAAGQSSSSTSYVVIQSSPGNRVVTTNTAGKKALQIPQIVGRVNAGGINPQFQTVVRPLSASGPPPLLSRATVSVGGIRPLNPQAAGQRGQPVTKVLLPRTGPLQQIMAVPFRDAKMGDQQRITLGGSPVRLLAGGMKVATIPSVPTEARVLKSEVGKPTVFQTSASGIGTSTQGQPIKVIQARPMGVLTPNKVQQIIPTSPGGKGLVVNKVLPGTGTRVTLMPQGTKSPAKILPAPSPHQTGQAVSPQKVIIRQATIKPAPTSGTLGLRIPTSNQPIVANTSSFQPVQVAGRQMQYVRLVSIPSASDSTAAVTTTAVPKGSTVLTLASTSSNSQAGSGIKMIPVGSSTPKTVLTKSVSGQRLIIPASLSMTQIKTSVPSSVMSAVCSSTNSTANSSVVVLPSTSVQSTKMSDHETEMDIKPIIRGLSDDSLLDELEADVPQKEPMMLPVSAKLSKVSVPEPNGIKPRKPCNCTKSQCLKLYCDCFANGEFCYQCNCNCCFNNLEHEEDRQRAIRSCLERNPNAFRPKIGKGMIGDGRRHNKGCNCKRSGCLKNYCECYEAKIACSNNCKCIGCKNIEDDVDRRSLRELIEVSDMDSPLLLTGGLKKKSLPQIDMPPIKLEDSYRRGNRRSDCIMSDSVVNATCDCLVAQAEKAEKMDLDDIEAEKLIVEEFGRCLVEIISCVTNRTDPDRHDVSSSSSVSEPASELCES